MIIEAPQISEQGPWAVAAAKVSFRNPEQGYPPTFRVQVPITAAHRLSHRGDGFLVAMFLLAMRAGESIEVRAPVSPRLLHGLHEFQKVIHNWYPDEYHVVEVSADEQAAVPPGPDADVYGAFSGGVDSFFTLRSHLESNTSSSGPAISCGLFAHGFDIPLGQEAQFETISADFQSLFHDLGKQLLPVWSNIQEFRTRYDWPIFHGASLIALAHILGQGARTLYVPSSHTYDTVFPWGTAPFLDHLLSSEGMQIVHDGAWANRIEKVESLVDWPATYSRLRVCIPGIENRNCCQCEKCIRTMVVLQLLGSLERYDTFPEPLQRHQIRDCDYRYANEFKFAREIFSFARRQGRYREAMDVGYAIVRSFTRHQIGALTRAARGFLTKR